MNLPEKILKQFEPELQKLKEEDNVPIRRSSNSNSRNSNIHRIQIPKKTGQNIRKGEITMIPAKGLFDDYNAIDKENIPAAEKVWKYIPKLLKIILNCRTNTAKIMEKMGIEKETIPTKEVKKEEVVK